MEHTLKTQYSGYLFAVCGVFLFSLKPILIKLIYEYPVDSATLMTLRMGFSLPIYLLIGVFLMLKNRIHMDSTRPLLPSILLTGILGYYGASYLDLTGLQYISAQLERLILFAYPSLVVILGYCFFGSPIQRGTVTALILTYCGIATLFIHDLKLSGEHQAYGGMLVLGSALLYALYILHSKPLIGKIGSLAFTCIAMCAASGAILVHFFLSKDLNDLYLPTTVYVTAFAIAIFSTILPSFLISEAIHRLGTNATSIVGSSGAVMTSLLAVAILGEDFTLFHALALILVTSGIVWLGSRKS